MVGEVVRVEIGGATGGDRGEFRRRNSWWAKSSAWKSAEQQAVIEANFGAEIHGGRSRPRGNRRSNKR
jgi:hypothetical protein